MEAEYDAIIIGAGISGLTVAGLLSRHGFRVLVLERHTIVGGCCSTFRRAKFIFDAAVHTMSGWAPGDVVHSWFTELEAVDEIQFARLDPFYCVAVGQERIMVPANLDELGHLLCTLSPGDSSAVATFIQDMKTHGFMALEGALDIDSSLARNPGSGMALGRVSWTSWADYLAGRFQDPRLEIILHALAFYLGLDPDNASALIMCAMFCCYHGGAFYPLGSTQRFVDTMAMLIRRWGGTIRRRSEVQRILYNKQGRAQGVRLANGEEITARFVVSCADMTRTLTEWTDRELVPPSILRKLRHLEPSSSAMLLYLAVREGGWSLPNHETFFLPGWKPLTADNFYYRSLGQENGPILSITAPSFSDPSLAPPGHHVVSMMCVTRAADVEKIREEQGKAALTADMLAHCERLVPGLTKNIIYKELATARTIERYTRNHQGSASGWAKNTTHWLNAIKPQEVLPGLYVAGHWTRGAYGVYDTFVSGTAAARTIIQAERPMSIAVPELQYS